MFHILKYYGRNLGEASPVVEVLGQCASEVAAAILFNASSQGEC